MQQIRTNLEMESHEEKLHQMIQQSKMESAKDQANIAAKNIRERQREQQRQGGTSLMQGIGSSSNMASSDEINPITSCMFHINLPLELINRLCIYSFVN